MTMEAPTTPELTPEQAQAAQENANVRTLKEQAGHLADNLRRLADRTVATAENIAVAPKASADLLKRMAAAFGGGALALDTWEAELKKRMGG